MLLLPLRLGGKVSLQISSVMADSLPREVNRIMNKRVRLRLGTPWKVRNRTGDEPFPFEP